MPTILLVDDKPGVRQLLAEELAFQGYTVIAIGSVASVDEIIRFSNLDLVIMDPYIKGQHRLDLLSDIKIQDPRLPVLVVTDFASYRRDPRSTLAAGILVKGFDLNDLFLKVAEVFRQKGLHPHKEARRVPNSSYPIQKHPGIDRTAVLAGSDGKAAMNLAAP